MNAVNGRDQLHDLLPEGGFTLNRVYAPYRPGMGRPSGAGSATLQSGKGCPSERCFGSALINWQPRLAACARDVKVGVVDTGFDQAHPAFAGVRYHYKEFLPEGSARASDVHGTGVLSLLAGNPGTGTPGLIPDASYVFANAFFADTDGQPISDTAQMLQALHWLKRSGVAVVNLSFAGPDDELLHHAVRELTKAGAVVVAAAGNEGPGRAAELPRRLPGGDRRHRGRPQPGGLPLCQPWRAHRHRGAGRRCLDRHPRPARGAADRHVVRRALCHRRGCGGAAGVGAGARHDALAAKRRALVQLEGNIKNLGGAGRDPTFGAGLVQAPATCGAAPAAVAASTPPASQTWVGTVRRASEPANARPVAVGTWVSTVQTALSDTR